MLAHKSNLPNMIKPHKWLKHFPNQSRNSQISQSMSEFSGMMEEHANPRIWRENNGKWVGNKR